MVQTSRQIALCIKELISQFTEAEYSMIRITCDVCGAIKRGRQSEWIIGYDLQYDTPRAVGRSISFFPRWDDSRVLEHGAVHFCSPECKEQYVAGNTLTVAKPRKVAARRKQNVATRKKPKVAARKKSRKIA